ncbi:MAG: hypothetical protein LBN21_11170 [Treponema sp.]|jgi:hypothetical protein|nr:hypothetical protein [Treponema sp.]
MHILQEIINESRDYDDLIKRIEIYIAKQDILNSMPDGKNCVKIFPKDGSHYITLSAKHGMDERLYVVFHRLYQHGLHNYINTIHYHDEGLKIYIKKMYSVAEVKKEFFSYLDGMMHLCGDEWSYEILEYEK